KASSAMANSITGCLRLSASCWNSNNEAPARPAAMPNPFRKVPRRESVGSTKGDKDDVVSRWPEAGVSKTEPSFANLTTYARCNSMLLQRDWALYSLSGLQTFACHPHRLSNDGCRLQVRKKSDDQPRLT